jgi:DNA-binding NarL/FixJ family response regulator
MGTAVIASISDPSASAFLASDVAKWRLMVGEAPEFAPPETGEEAPGPTDAATALNAEIFRVTAAIFAGDLDLARATIASGRRHAEAVRSVSRHGVSILDFAEFLVTAFGGRIDAALEFAERSRGEIFEEPIGMWNYGLALFTLHGGKAVEAMELASSAVEQLAWRDFLGARGAATALHATVAAQLGRQRLARDILDSIGPDAGGYVATQLQAAEAEAWILVLAGDVPGAITVIQRAVTVGIDSRYHSMSALTAYLAVRLGHAQPVLDQLRAITATANAELIGVLLAHAEALAARDIPALLAAAERLSTVGLRAGAVDAARQAAAIARESGKEKIARRASLLAKSWDDGLSGMRHHEKDDPTITLSQREWAVATAAAGRERNREIAGRLGLSERTVENHLTNIYRKLGVSGRDELRRELDALGPVQGSARAG